MEIKLFFQFGHIWFRCGPLYTNFSNSRKVKLMLIPLQDHVSCDIWLVCIECKTFADKNFELYLNDILWINLSSWQMYSNISNHLGEVLTGFEVIVDQWPCWTCIMLRPNCPELVNFCISHLGFATSKWTR